MVVARETAQTGEFEKGSGVARHIAREAARLFAARGYDATSVREIVAAAGVTKPTLYYHFGSKGGLGQALVTRPLAGLLDQMRAILAEVSEPEQALVRLLACSFAFVRDDPDRGRFVYALFFGPLGMSLAAELAHFAESIDALWEALAHRLADSGRIDRDAVTDFTAAIRGLVVVHTVDHLYRGEPLGPDLPARIATRLFEGFGRMNIPRNNA